MNKTALLLVAVVIASGCVEGIFSGIITSESLEQSLGYTKYQSPDITVEVDASPAEIKTGRQTSVHFLVQNNQPDTPLQNVSINVYDFCGFTNTDSTVPLSAVISENELKENRTKDYYSKYLAPNIQFDRECNIRFSTSYESSVKMTQTIATLERTEYFTREEQGTLGQISVMSSSTYNPLKIGVSFSEPQPFLEDETVYMYIDYSYEGDGYIEKINAGDIEIRFPSNVVAECNNFVLDDATCSNKECGEFSTSECADHVGCSIENALCSALELDECRENIQCAYTAPIEQGCNGDVTISNCEGTPPVCGGTNRTVCRSIKGCIWMSNSYCAGTPEKCEYYDASEAECESQLGCNYILETCNDLNEIECYHTSGCTFTPGTEGSCKGTYTTICSGTTEVCVGPALRLNRDITFYNKAAAKSTCALTIAPNAPVDSKSMTIEANYKYVFDNSILVKTTR